jgi:hypothetical protein
MLESLDVLIGFVVVMLVVSMAVTMITQAWISFLFNYRGKSLHEGLSHLLALMDHGLLRDEAAKIADHILRNPLVGTSPLFGTKFGLGSVIHREELTKLLLDFAIPGPAETANPDAAKEALRAAFSRSLARNGISNPEEILSRVRTTVMELEKSCPGLSHSVRANLALLQHAESDFLSKLNSWFDQTVDRASEVFTRRVRLVTGIVALIVAVVLQLDAVGLVNRLSVDAPVRDRLVQSAIQNESAWQQQQQRQQQQLAALQARSGASTSQAPDANAVADVNSSAGNSTASNSIAGGNVSDGNSVTTNASAAGNGLDCNPPAANDGAGGNAAAGNAAAVNATAGGNATDGDSVTALSVPAENCPTEWDQLRGAHHMIGELGIVSIPDSPSAWLRSWSAPRDGQYDDRWPRVFGILLAAALLSLGAPFWYAVLSNLLKLRSVIAGKDEEQRNERQTTQTTGPLTQPIVMTPAPPASPSPPSPPADTDTEAEET